MSLFKEANKQKLRFLTSKGSLTSEQLWDLSQTELSTCIKAVKKLLNKNNDDELSFLDSNVNVDKTEQLRFDILKEVYLEKKRDSDAIKEARDIKENNQKIMALIAEKQDNALQTKTIEELTAMLK